ncbi:MAG: M14 family zinc carboxypeptidase, partial [Bacteroidales bacterium]|nr:M14 family zinc carboxypeptidase [Bacteroidales bacterium]
MKRILFLIGIILCSHLPQAVKAQEYYFKISESDKELVNTKITCTVSIDRVEGDTIFAYANQKEFEALKALGYLPELLENPTLAIKNRGMATTIDQMANWDLYPTYEVYRSMMKKFEQDYPGLCKLDSIGTSVQGRKLYVVKISDNVLADEAEHEFFYTSTMHGDETTGYVLMLRLIDYLLSSYGTDSRVTDMVNSIAIYINPNANPDGTYYGGNHTVNNSRRYNANNVDINRNFPDPRVGENPGGNYQPETVAMMEYADSRSFVMSANIHGGIELANFPWDTWNTATNAHADHSWFYTISRQYADFAQAASPSGYFTGQGNGVTQGGDWYVITGGRQDYMNYWHNCREITLEISGTKNPASSTLPNYWTYNKEAMLSHIEWLYTGIQGTVTNTQDEPLNATITIANHDKDNSFVVTNPINGNYIRMIEPGTYDVNYSAEGYISQTHSISIGSNTSQVIKDVALVQAEQTSLSG